MGNGTTGSLNGAVWDTMNAMQQFEHAWRDQVEGTLAQELQQQCEELQEEGGWDGDTAESEAQEKDFQPERETLKRESALLSAVQRHQTKRLVGHPRPALKSPRPLWMSENRVQHVCSENLG